MADQQHNDDLTIREIEYSFLIKEKEKGISELNDILRSELTRFEDSRRKTIYTENPIREFLKTNIERSIVIRDTTRVYFTNYQEKGVYAIQFTLLIITRYVNYGSTRQALDYLIKDTIGNYFEELLERHLPVSVSVHSADNQLFEFPVIQGKNESQSKSFRETLPLILASIALFISITSGLLWLFQKNQPAEKIKPSEEYRDKYFELLIEKKITDALNKEKLNYFLYENSITASDSGQNNIYKKKIN